MDKSLKWRFLLLLVVVIISGFYLVPSFVKLPSWWEATFPSETISLGLDLQGGMHLMLEVETEKAVSNTIDRTVSDLNDLLFNEKIPVDRIERAGTDKLTLGALKRRLSGQAEQAAERPLPQPGEAPL